MAQPRVALTGILLIVATGVARATPGDVELSIRVENLTEEVQRQTTLRVGMPIRWPGVQEGVSITQSGAQWQAEEGNTTPFARSLRIERLAPYQVARVHVQAQLEEITESALTFEEIRDRLSMRDVTLPAKYDPGSIVYTGYKRRRSTQANTADGPLRGDCSEMAQVTARALSWHFGEVKLVHGIARVNGVDQLHSWVSFEAEDGRTDFVDPLQDRGVRVGNYIALFTSRFDSGEVPFQLVASENSALDLEVRIHR